MHIKFYTFGKDERESQFGMLLQEATGTLGDSFEVADGTAWQGDHQADADVAAFLGVTSGSRVITEAYRRAGKRSITLDKGAIRTNNRSEYKRVYMDGGTALAYMHRKKRPRARWEKLGIKLHTLRLPGKTAPVVYAANSQKVADYWNLGNVHDLAVATLNDIRKLVPKRLLVYRPKPRALDFEEIQAVRFSVKPEQIEGALRGAHCLVTHTSHCTVNALIAGIPCIALAPNVARGCAGKYIDQVVAPPWPTEQERFQFFCNLAYTQWTDDEFVSGEAWEFIKRELAATAVQPGEPIKPLPVEQAADDDFCNDTGQGRIQGTPE